MKKEMLINVLQPEECRIAIVEDGVLEELYVERTSHESYTGNIYKGKIVNLEPAIQAAFVDFSVGRNGFLHVSDVEPQYFHRHPTADEDPEVRPRPRPPERERDRGRKPPQPPPPRRERGRGRDDRRPGLPPEPNDLPPPYPTPPGRIEERPRDRDRDPARDRLEPPRDRDREPPRDRGRDRERPDLSLRGRRDRSEPPRRFGEGLADMSDDLEPPPRPAAHSTEHASLRAAEDILNAGPEPTQAGEWPEVAERHSDPDIGWGRDIEPERTPERRPEREFRPREPEAPSTRGSESEEVFDPDLPPSRTQRSRPMTERPRPIEPEPSEFGRHRPNPSFPAEREPRERIEPAIPEPDIESFGSRDPKKGRGRGRSPAPPGRGRPSPPAGRAEPPFPGVEREPIAESPRPEPVFEDVPPLEEPPRRRGGRAAIRSRAGDWDRPRENPVPPAADVERLLEPERRRPADPVEPIREREPERERPRDRDPVRDRERPRPHARAGEPGYIPRRERLRSGDSPFGEDLFPAETEWTEREFDPLLEEDAGAPSAEFPDEDDANLLEEEGPGAPGGARPEARRRRRRRGRRREPERPPGKFEPPALPAPDGGEPEFEDFPADLEAPRPFARSGLPDVESFDELDELDLEEIGGPGRHDLDDDEFAGDEPTRIVADEEIDPELEQEIRKEIEEIDELEREMGLRGGPERAGEETGRGGRSGRGRGPLKPPIQEIFRRGDEVLIQVIKESIGTKGPTLSTYISIPGRYLVLMPGLNRVGVSRKIVNEGQRRKLREIMLELNPPKGLGFIVRTAGLERTKRELARDLAYLLRLWKVILRRIKKSRARPRSIRNRT